MSARPISESLRNFIFEHLDSVECLEVLLLLYADPLRAWSPDQMASELRSNPNSAEKRAHSLRSAGILLSTSADLNAAESFRYRSESRELNDIVEELAYHNRIQRHKLYELIFSPLKKARDFADAFKKQPEKPGSREDSSNG